MKIIRADQLNALYTRQDVIDAFCVKMMDEIKNKNQQGYRKTCFYVCGGYYNHHSKTITYKDNGGQYHHWDDYKRDIEKVFIAAGYTIKATGYIGGVWQRTEDIMW